MSDNKLNERQINLLVSIRTGRDYSFGDIRTLISEESKKPPVSPATLRRDLAELVHQGFLIQAGELKGTRYSLNPRGQLHAPLNAHSYCSVDIDSRSGNARFNPMIFSGVGNSLFNTDELDQLTKATHTFLNSGQGGTPAVVKRELERFVIELSWKSSKIEGNTYSLLDTELLLKEGLEAAGKSSEETRMVLNHKKAFDFILENKSPSAQISISLIKDIHRLLVEGLGIQFGIRRRLIGITGSIYRPLDVPTQIEEACDNLLSAVNRQNDPYSRALLLLAGLAYIQPFEDGNKRCSRLSANALLLSFDCAPLSYRSISEVAYREAMLTFYERNTIEPLKALFIEQYVFACHNYLKFA